MTALERVQYLKTKIPQVKSIRDTKRGRLESTLERIERVSSLSTVEEAVEEVLKIQRNLEIMDKALEEGCADLEERFEW